MLVAWGLALLLLWLGSEVGQELGGVATLFFLSAPRRHFGESSPKRPKA
jgi:hypothetical protein